MTVRRYLLILFIFTVIAWILWGLVISFINPQTGSAMAISLFYITFFLSLMGSFTLIGYVIRVIADHQEMTRQRLNIALRQGVLFSILINVSLYLKAANKLGWLSILILIVILSLIEFFFLSLQHSNQQQA